MKIVPFSFLILLLCSCSTAEKKRINDKVLNETQVTDGPSLNKSAHHLITGSKTLTLEQKNVLTGIIDEIKLKNQTLTTESYKYRGVLMKELLSGHGRKDIKIVEKQISKIERQRLRNTIDAAKKISTIVEGEKEEKEILNSFMFKEISGRY